MKTNSRKFRTVYLCAAGLSAVLICVSSNSAAEGIWEEKAEMKMPSFGVHASAVGDRIYAIGGRDTIGSEHPSGTVQAYDPHKNVWVLKRKMPTVRGFFGTAVAQSKIYAIGGSAQMNFYDPGLEVVEEYDPATDTWKRRADLPTPRADLIASAVNGKIYAIGGTRTVAFNALPTVEEYDPVTNTWTRRADMLKPRLHHTGAVVDGKIYVFGGSPEWPVPLAETEAYDPTTDSWSRLADMPTPRTGAWAAALNGKIYVVGGRGWDQETPALTTVEVYDPATNTWAKEADMPTPRFLLAVESAAGRIFAIGGATNDFTSLATVEALTP